MKAALPKSCTSLSLNFFGVFCFIVGIYFLGQYFPDMALIWRTALSGLFLVIPIVLVESLVFKVHQNPTAKLTHPGEINNIRVGIKVLGLFGTFCFIGFFYWVFPEYNHTFYDSYYDVIRYVVPTVLAFSWYYFAAIDRRMREPEDGYWHVGCVVLGKWNLVETKILAEHFRGWIVKGFFFPLMFIYLMNNVNFLTEYNYNEMNGSFVTLYDFLYSFIFTIDVMFACVGYVMTFRILDSHIRSVEPTMLGWLVAVMCYQPFWSGIFYGAYFAYDDGFNWGNMMHGNQVLYAAWGSAIIFCIAVYSTATVCLGYRFSNLTYRGLVTNGPYKFTKHPAYISKNISWWLISVPFFANADLDITIRQTFLLLGVNYIYYMRARTEENHLSNYPEYVEYAKWIEENGIFRWVGRILPYFRYSEERAKEWHSLTWFKKMGKKEY